MLHDSFLFLCLTALCLPKTRWAADFIRALGAVLDVPDGSIHGAIPLLYSQYLNANGHSSMLDRAEQMAASLRSNMTRQSAVQGFLTIFLIILYGQELEVADTATQRLDPKVLQLLRFDARTSVLLRRLALLLRIKLSALSKLEDVAIRQMQESSRQAMIQQQQQHSQVTLAQNQWIRATKICAGAMAAGGVLALTGGMAAPALATGLATLGFASAATFATATTVAALLGGAGAGFGAYKMTNRTKGLTRFEFRQVNSQTQTQHDVQDVGSDEIKGMTVYICISGYLRQAGPVEKSTQDTATASSINSVSSMLFTTDPTNSSDFYTPWGAEPPIKFDSLILDRFYSVVAPEKRKLVPYLLRQYYQQEDEMMNELERIYGVHPKKLAPPQAQPNHYVVSDDTTPVYNYLLDHGLIHLKQSIMETCTSSEDVPQDCGYSKEMMDLLMDSNVSWTEACQAPKCDKVQPGLLDKIMFKSQQSKEEEFSTEESNTSETNEEIDQDSLEEEEFSEDEDECEDPENETVRTSLFGKMFPKKQGEEDSGDGGSVNAAKQTLSDRIFKTQQSREEDFSNDPRVDYRRRKEPKQISHKLRDALAMEMEAINLTQSAPDLSQEEIVKEKECETENGVQNTQEGGECDEVSLTSTLSSSCQESLSSSQHSRSSSQPPTPTSQPAEVNEVYWWRQSVANHGDQYTLVWEPENLLALGKSIQDIIMEGLSKGLLESLKFTVLSAVVAAVAIPTAVVQFINTIDDSWSLATHKADKVGKILADALMSEAHGNRPVVLIGYSVGGRVVASCLSELAAIATGTKGRRKTKKEQENETKVSPVQEEYEFLTQKIEEDSSLCEKERKRRLRAATIVRDAVIIGSPCDTSPSKWAKRRSVVLGRLVNVYNPVDWVLALLYRYKRWSVLPIAGLKEVKFPSSSRYNEFSQVENFNVSDIVDGHGDYPAKIREILHRVGVGDVDCEDFLPNYFPTKPTGK